MNPPNLENFPPAEIAAPQWRADARRKWLRSARAAYPPRKTLVLACGLFVLTLITCLAAGAQFAFSYARNQAVSIDEFVRSFELVYKNPEALVTGLPFALTLLAILLAHELGHFFACRYHGIRSTYPFFIPAPTLIGTLGAFILIRSPIRSRRALFDVGASGPLAGFIVALPALLFGIWRAKVVPDLAASSDILFGVPLAQSWLSSWLHHGVDPQTLLIDPIGRAAWVGLFATALNLLPAGQLDGGHILRAVSPRWHRILSWGLPVLLLPLGYFLWWVWFIWAAMLLGLRFLRSAPVHDGAPLDASRLWLAVLTLAILILCFMPGPLVQP